MSASDSLLAINLEKILNNSARTIATIETSIDTILWGKNSPTPPAGSSVPTSPIQSVGNFVDSGLFNVINAINSVDLCNVLTYLLGNITPNNKRPPEVTWNEVQKLFYGLQDDATLVAQQIDKYTAYPNILIGNYTGVGPNAVPPEQAAQQSGAQSITGTSVTAYNIYNLFQSIRATFSPDSPNSIFSAQNTQLVSSIPGLSVGIKFLNNFFSKISKYSDYRQIPSSELTKLENLIAQVRSICITISNLSIGTAVTLIGNFLKIDVRSDVQKLSKYFDPTKIIPTLSKIDASIKSFINTVKTLQGIISTIQFFIKLATLFYKIYTFIETFFYVNPTPEMYLTSGITAKLGAKREAATNEKKGALLILKLINTEVSLIIQVLNYIIQNTQELLNKLNTLLLNLEACKAVQGSDVVNNLTNTTKDLQTLQNELQSYVNMVSSNPVNNPEVSTFGPYTIVIEKEQVTDPQITNLRRRGVALDKNGSIVAQSQLTFATDNNVIIQETELNLISQGLVTPPTNTINADDQAIINQSLSYLNVNDVVLNNFTVPTPLIDSPNNTNENDGLGLNAFLNNLPGGKSMRQRSNSANKSYQQNIQSQIQQEGITNSTISI